MWKTEAPALQVIYSRFIFAFVSEPEASSWQAESRSFQPWEWMHRFRKLIQIMQLNQNTSKGLFSLPVIRLRFAHSQGVVATEVLWCSGYLSDLIITWAVTLRNKCCTRGLHLATGVWTNPSPSQQRAKHVQLISSWFTYLHTCN